VPDDVTIELEDAIAELTRAAFDGGLAAAGVKVPGEPVHLVGAHERLNQAIAAAIAAARVEAACEVLGSVWPGPLSGQRPAAIA
jgi:hypothetical protein